MLYRSAADGIGIVYGIGAFSLAQDISVSVKEAKAALEMGLTYDAVTVSLEDAISELLEMTGERTSDEVIDRVFHNFCVGK